MKHWPKWCDRVGKWGGHHISVISSNSRWGSTKTLLYTYVKKGKTLNFEVFLRYLTHNSERFAKTKCLLHTPAMQTQLTEAIIGRFHIYKSCYFTVCYSTYIRIRTINRKSRLTSLIPNKLCGTLRNVHTDQSLFTVFTANNNTA